ncbi:MAG: hypothetical protein HOP20_07060 [Sulfuriferula sp.]|nr:hypothetical protein [Sulfuriferula sp.]
MPRQNRAKSRSKQLIATAWKTPAFIAFILLFIIHYGFPLWTTDNPIRHAITVAIRPFGLFAAALFATVALINFIRAEIRSKCSSRRIIDDDLGKLKPTHSKPDTWSLALLKQIEWKRFEELCAAYFRELGLRAETIKCGADGGVDVKLFRGDASEPHSILQCKAWNSRYVGVKPVRELFGVMAHQKIRSGIFLTTSTYTEDALTFAKEHPIFLIDGEKFFNMIGKLSHEAQQKLLAVATEGDYLVPSCPSCGIKMIERKGPKSRFWGCSNYPKCKLTFAMRDTSLGT